MTIPLIPSWVHSLADYRSMFDLNDAELKLPILDFPAGISCFNAQMHELGHQNVISADRFYDLSAMDMGKHVEFVIQGLTEKLDQLTNHINVSEMQDVEDLANSWNQNAQAFRTDFSSGQQAGRYQQAVLPTLPFSEHQFELALCSDMLFRNDQLSPESVVTELCRVAREVRIFPLMDETGQVSGKLGPIMLEFQQQNFGVEVKEVPYTLLKKNNAMLRIWARECVV